ncbi:MAG: tRNA (N6-threonylcarbamoyladenosine(37)-N6)-methyltransferase TrmO [Clostridiales bacterium]|nr:tRNA (N6-threonylcarbamoyladenosine(37)-N6)-methyltransferase TrmO [Clostridiales bacterium]
MSGLGELTVIAHIRTDFPEKFGVPRQSGLVPELAGTILFEPDYRDPEALRGLEDYDYIWLLWGFQGTDRAGFRAVVRPPRLGGNQRVGVFATRSPFRPNPIGLSSVKLEGVFQGQDGPVIKVSGIDMRDGTPIYDIKPYLPGADSHPGVRGGFAEQVRMDELEVDFPEHLLDRMPPSERQTVLAVLRQDPRPQYQRDPERVYGMAFRQYNIQFTVADNRLRVTGLSNRQS